MLQQLGFEKEIEESDMKQHKYTTKSEINIKNTSLSTSFLKIKSSQPIPLDRPLPLLKIETNKK